MSNLLLRHNEASNRIVPVRELLTHFAQMRPLLMALTEADKLRDFLELGHGYFARTIDRCLGDVAGDPRNVTARASSDAAGIRRRFSVSSDLVDEDDVTFAVHPRRDGRDVSSDGVVGCKDEAAAKDK